MSHTNTDSLHEVCTLIFAKRNVTSGSIDGVLSFNIDDEMQQQEQMGLHYNQGSLTFPTLEYNLQPKQQLYVALRFE